MPDRKQTTLSDLLQMLPKSQREYILGPWGTIGGRSKLEIIVHLLGRGIREEQADRRVAAFYDQADGPGETVR
jgi:hypothetical protein